jgi:hypothetical protein
MKPLKEESIYDLHYRQRQIIDRVPRVSQALAALAEVGVDIAAIEQALKRAVNTAVIACGDEAMRRSGRRVPVWRIRLIRPGTYRSDTLTVEYSGNDRPEVCEAAKRDNPGYLVDSCNMIG